MTSTDSQRPAAVSGSNRPRARDQKRSLVSVIDFRIAAFFRSGINCRTFMVSIADDN